MQPAQLPVGENSASDDAETVIKFSKKMARRKAAEAAPAAPTPWISSHLEVQLAAQSKQIADLLEAVNVLNKKVVEMEKKEAAPVGQAAPVQLPQTQP